MDLAQASDQRSGREPFGTLVAAACGGAARGGVKARDHASDWSRGPDLDPAPLSQRLDAEVARGTTAPALI